MNWCLAFTVELSLACYNQIKELGNVTTWNFQLDFLLIGLAAIQYSKSSLHSRLVNAMFWRFPWHDAVQKNLKRACLHWQIVRFCCLFVDIPGSLALSFNEMLMTWKKKRKTYKKKISYYKVIMTCQLIENDDPILTNAVSNNVSMF